jgi:hypothetical protein
MPGRAPLPSPAWHRCGKQAQVWLASRHWPACGGPGRCVICRLSRLPLNISRFTVDLKRHTAGVPAPPGERDDVARHLTQARGELGQAAYDERWSAGAMGSPADIVATALAAPSRRGGGENRSGRSEELTPRKREVALLLNGGDP